MPPDPALRYFPDEFVPNVQTANKTSYSQFRRDNPAEAAKWEKFRDDVIAGKQVEPPSMSTKYGRMLVAAGKEHMSISRLIGQTTNPYPPPDPPPPVPPPPVPPSGGLSSPYFNEDFVNISNPQWDTVQTYTASFNPGPSPGVQQDASGRLSLVTAPDGVGRALRYEIRNSDPGWANDTSVHRCQLGAPTQSMWNAAQMSYGDIRWFDFELWLPDEFDWARDWNALIGAHPASSTGWGCFNIVIEPYSNPHPHWIQFKLAGGSPPGSTANLRYRNLIQLSNANGSSYAPNRNRRIHLRYGGKFNPDNTGWAEAWVDGVNVLPRQNGPTCWTDDFDMYLKLGPYKNRPPTYPSGRTVLYITRAQIGRTE